MSLNKLALLPLSVLLATGCVTASVDIAENRPDAVGHSVSVVPMQDEDAVGFLAGDVGGSNGSGDQNSNDGVGSGEVTDDEDTAAEEDTGSDGSGDGSTGADDGSTGSDDGATGSDGSTGSDDGAVGTDDGSDTATGSDDGATGSDDGATGSDDGSDVVDSGDVFGMYSLYVDSTSDYSKQATEWRDSDPDAASLMDAMAAQALAVWVGDWTSDVTASVDKLITEGGSQLRTLVVYNIPDRDCGAWSSGGAADATEYAAFIKEIADGIDGRPVILVLEPDALPLTHCLSDSEAEERYDMMGDAVDVLAAAGASVYLDSGDSNWIDATRMADKLEKANVANAAGFSLNVSHTEFESDEMAFAEEIRAIIGETAHYIIDSSRSGLGPTEDNEWCNPLGRAVGSLPTTITGIDGLDAYLWVKPPGDSDGSCNDGPIAGKFWPEYALELAELSTTL